MKFLSPEEYAQLGFMCGVEIHQQLLTDMKMFCHCPAGLYSDEYDAEVLRHMRPTLSELGEYDGTALMEFKTKKQILYRLNKESVCTYEMDDTPPFLVNQQGLDIAIEICLLLNLNLVDEMHIARKQYLDGSIPTGFQRTAIVGVEGFILFKDKKIRLIQLSIEEDSCREVEDRGHNIIFKTDRLGMPLIEAVTYPDMKTPWEAAEVVETLGRILRVTEKVRRGLGSVRQDVNVSIRGGTRIEIKGVPKFGFIPALTHIEALRQKALLDIRQEIKRRSIDADNFQWVEKDVTHLLKDTTLPQFRKAMKKGHRIRAIKLCGLAGILNHPTQPDINFDRELAGRVRVIACLDEQPIIFHTDNYRLYEGYRKDLKNLRKVFKSSDLDVIILVWGPEEDTITAIDEIRLRMVDAMKGVPSETRQACSDGTTDFERILPGADRMYPDTDLPPTKIDGPRIQRIRSQLPELPWVREDRYKKHSLPPETAYRLAVSPHARLFDRIERELKVEMKLVGITLVQVLKALKRGGYEVKNITPERIYEIFQGLSQGRFYPALVKDLLKIIARSPEKSLNQLLENFSLLSEGEALQIMEETLAEDPLFVPSWDTRNRLFQYYSGKIMKKLRGRFPAHRVEELVKERVDGLLKERAVKEG